MFRITRDPSSGSSIQCLVKITVMVLSCLLIWTWSVRVCTAQSREAPSASVDCAANTRTDHVHANRHDRTITVILTKHCIELPL